jgi:hypothetical protein
MSLNDNVCHFVLCRSRKDETELEDFRSHSCFVCLRLKSGVGEGGVRLFVMTSKFVFSRLGSTVNSGRRGRHGRGSGIPLGYVRNPLNILVRDNFTRVQIVHLTH